MRISVIFFFFSSRTRHTIWNCDWSSDVCSSDLHTKLSRKSGRNIYEPANEPAARRHLDGKHSSPGRGKDRPVLDRKSTRLNSSHSSISYAVFCLKKKKKKTKYTKQ